MMVDVMVDPHLAELRRRIAVAFSTGELARFAHGIHVHLDREGSVDDTARALIRAMQARDRIGDLLARLRAHKPDVHWPDIEPEPKREREAEPHADPQPEPQLQADPHADAHAEREAEPQLQADPHADPQLQAEPHAGSANAAASSLAPDPAAPDVADRAAPARAAAAPVIIPSMLGAVLAAGIAVGAAFSWLALRAKPAAEPRAPIARLAAEQLDDSVAAVVRACGRDDGDDASDARDRLRRALGRCAPDAAQRSAAPDSMPPAAIAPGNTGNAPLFRLGPSPTLPGADSCLTNCNAAHTACRSNRCGPEPSSPDKYAAWQRCQAACLTNNSRCRLACR